jgi:hypothetical protein
MSSKTFKDFQELLEHSLLAAVTSREAAVSSAYYEDDYAEYSKDCRRSDHPTHSTEPVWPMYNSHRCWMDKKVYSAQFESADEGEPSVRHNDG